MRIFDLAVFAVSHKNGWAVAEQAQAVMDHGDLHELNANALNRIRNVFEKLQEMTVADFEELQCELGHHVGRLNEHFEEMGVEPDKWVGVT